MTKSEQPLWVDSKELATMSFLHAAEAWLATRSPYLSPKTFHEYEMNITTNRQGEDRDFFLLLRHIVGKDSGNEKSRYS
jgi:hypothetical protein